MISFRGGINLKEYGSFTNTLGGRSEKAIYGVSWTKVASPTLTRTDDSVGFTANAGVDATPVSNDFDVAQIYKDIIEVTDGDGNVFVRIPKFYIRKTDGVGTKTWQISRFKHSTDWYLPWCFWDFTNSVELPYVDVGKYTGSVSATKLQSKANTYPTINTNIVDFRAAAQANGAGYQQLDIHVVDMLQTLFYVEFATLNSQSIMAGFTAGQFSASHVITANSGSATNTLVVANATGALYAVGQAISVGTSLGGNQRFYGRTITQIDADTPGAGSTTITFDGAAVETFINDILYNTGWINGFSSGIAASSGSLVSNSTGLYACHYRGIENPYGNVWQFVDGVNVNDLQAWVCTNAASYASNLFAAPYTSLSYVNHNANGYFVTVGYDSNYSFAALPTSVGGSSSTYFSDSYLQASGQRIALLGGSWGAGEIAGLSYWNLSNSSSIAGVNFCSRLCRKGG